MAGPEHDFDESERAALDAVLDTIVPPSADGRLPGAGALGLATAIAERLGASRAPIAKGLAALDERARALGADAFAALGAAERGARLREHAASDPGFLSGLIFHTYAAYYQHPRVVRALGLEARPPHPQGYPLEQADLDALLDAVRGGPRRYREV